MAVDCLSSSGTTPLVCNVWFNLKCSIFGFYPTSHIENKIKTQRSEADWYPSSRKTEMKGPTGPYEERWCKRLCYPRHSNFRGSDMSCPKVREWMISNVLHHYLNATELHSTTQYSVVWQIEGKINLWSTE